MNINTIFRSISRKYLIKDDIIINNFDLKETKNIDLLFYKTDNLKSNINLFKENVYLIATINSIDLLNNKNKQAH